MNNTSQRISLSDIGFGLIIVSYFLLVFSSPMPIKIGVLEIVMGIGLTMGASLLILSLIARKNTDIILPILCIAYFLMAPLLMGVVRGNDFADMARDVAPLMFMAALPLLITSLPQDKYAIYRLRVMLFAILAVGLVSALQFHHGIIKLFGSMETYIARTGPIPVMPLKEPNVLIDQTWSVSGLENIDYPSLMLKCQDPAILFTAIYLLCVGISHVLVKPRRLLYGIFALGGGAFCVYEFAALGLRAFCGLTALTLIIYAVYLIRSRKVSLANLMAAGVVGLLFTYSQIVNFATQMWAKQQAVGLSGRPGELYSAFGTISENVATLLFGVGWGGLLSNPIYDAATTRYTHSLFSYWLLKTGIVGLAALVLFVSLLIRRVDLKYVWKSSHRLAVFLAASAVIIIGLFFEPTYKMLSYGLIVGLLLAEYAKPLASKQEPNTIF